MTSELFSEIYNKALDILSRREHSVLELKQKLQKKYDTEYDIKETISRLKKIIYLMIIDFLNHMSFLEREKDLDQLKFLMNLNQKV